MLKLHVFLVDTGIMYTFDMEMALERYSKCAFCIFRFAAFQLDMFICQFFYLIFVNV